MRCLGCAFRLPAILLAFALLALAESAVAAEKASVRINYVTIEFRTFKAGGGDLTSISFSVENTANKPLEWVRLRVTARSYEGALLQTDTFEVDFSRNPIGSKEAKRITHYMEINGFLIGGKRGTTDVRVVDYRLWSEDGWLLVSPPYQDKALEGIDLTAPVLIGIMKNRGFYDVKKPVPEWRQVRSFNNRVSCEEYKKEAGDTSNLGRMNTLSYINALGYSLGRCVSSDSMKTKEPQDKINQ